MTGSLNMLNFILTKSAVWPLCSVGGIYPPLCYFSQPSSKVRAPKAQVVRTLCLLSMCVITSLKSPGPRPASWDICQLIASKNSEPETAVICWILVSAAYTQRGCDPPRSKHMRNARHIQPSGFHDGAPRAKQQSPVICPVASPNIFTVCVNSESQHRSRSMLSPAVESMAGERGP